MADRKCSIEGCNKKHIAKGFCSKHYDKLRKYGDPLFIKQETICSIEDCKEKHYALGFCNRHYETFKKYGDPLFTKTEKHGMSKTQTYRCWTNMKQRCNNKKKSQYKDYGGRGIKVCEEWINSFLEFHKDMGECPDNHSIDRIDVNGNYEPGNCRWADNTTQSQNTRTRTYSKTGCKGVTKLKDKFQALISKDGKNYYLKLHNTFEEAVIARLKGELKYWGYIQQTDFKHLLNNNNNN